VLFEFQLLKKINSHHKEIYDTNSTINNLLFNKYLQIEEDDELTIRLLFFSFKQNSCCSSVLVLLKFTIDDKNCCIVRFDDFSSFCSAFSISKR
jgi:hypothetical protein